MKTRIVHVSKLQSAKVMAVLYMVIAIPLTLASFVPLLAMHQPVAWHIILWVPFLYAVIGFVFTFLGAWLYNGIAQLVGGIEFTLSPSSDE